MQNNDEENQSDYQDEGIGEKRSRTYIQTKHSLPHPNIKFNQQLKMIKAYVLATNKGAKAIKYNELEGMVDFSLPYISGTNKFMEEIGILEKRHGQGMYAPTSSIIEFSNQIEWNNEEEAKKILRNIIEKSWFWESAKQILMMNNGQASKEDIIRKMGLDSQADRVRHKLCFRSMMDYLFYTKLIYENEEGLIELVDMQKSTDSVMEEEVKHEPEPIFKEKSVKQTFAAFPGSHSATQKSSPTVEFRYKGMYIKIEPSEDNIEMIDAIINTLNSIKEKITNQAV